MTEAQAFFPGDRVTFEIGTKFEKGYGEIWTIGGYVYYEGDLWYVCFDDDGCQRDEHHEDIEGWLGKEAKNED